MSSLYAYAADRRICAPWEEGPTGSSRPQILQICTSAESGLLRFRWDVIQRGALGHGRLALDAGLVLAEEPVEVGDSPRVHEWQVQRLAFLGIGDEIDDPG